MFRKIKRKEKQEKGITLLALVVTIIVIIILATVAINLLFGENGLVTKAQQGKRLHDIEYARERLGTVLADAFSEKKINPDYEPTEFLDKFIKEREPKAEAIEDEISLDGHTFELDRSVPQLGEYIGEYGNLPPRIKNINVTNKTYSEVSIEATTVRAEGVKYRFSYKKNDESDYQGSVEQESNTYTISNLETLVIYNVKVDLIKEKDIVDTETINVRLGELEEGSLTFGKVTWSEGTASLPVSTTTSKQIQYQIIPEEGEAGSWTTIANNGIITNIPNGATVCARLWDGAHGSEEITRTVVDSIAPVITQIEEIETTINTIKIRVEAVDNESGIAKIEYSSNNGESYTTGTSQTATEYEFTGLKMATEYTIKVRITDNANNTVDDFTNITTENDKLVDETLPTPPKLSDGMIPVKWNETMQKWVKTTTNDWYDYGSKRWANIVLKDATFITSDGVEILDESKTYSMLVWIPRYAYQITSGYHTSQAGNIEIVFIDTNNQNKEKTKTYSQSYPNATTGGGMDDYVVHPAFNYGDSGENKLSGFWVGKYEASSKEGNSNSTSEDNVTNKTVQIKAGVSSWRYIQVSNMYTVCINMNTSSNQYGLNTNDNVVDPHMMKNSEWGAVAYLSLNTTYGKGSEVWINPNSNFITGQAGTGPSVSSTTSTNAYNTSNGQQASTSGNTTGVYDISGCSWEYVAGYINNGHSNLNTYGSTLVNAANKHKDVYKVTSDSIENNYNNAQPTIGLERPTSSTGHYGDAVWETSYSGSSSLWFEDSSYIPCFSNPFFLRGGSCYDMSIAGAFGFNYNPGSAHYGYSFRIVLPVL